MQDRKVPGASFLCLWLDIQGLVLEERKKIS